MHSVLSIRASQNQSKRVNNSNHRSGPENKTSLSLSLFLCLSPSSFMGFVLLKPYGVKSLPLCSTKRMWGMARSYESLKIPRSIHEGPTERRNEIELNCHLLLCWLEFKTVTLPIQIVIVFIYFCIKYMECYKTVRYTGWD